MTGNLSSTNTTPTTKLWNNYVTECKLLEVKHDRICFIDSLSFFQMPLSAFPKTFGLTELRKGYFPHKFNIPENQEYVGSIPAQNYYMPEVMSPKARHDVVFDFKKELVAYCESDVRLLKEGCLTFKRLFEAKAGFNPFEHITIASACNRDLRMNLMIPNSIASEPVNGCRNRINQSQVALEWLNWCDHQRRQQALEQLTHEDLEAHDLMARAYPDHLHPSQCYYVQHVQTLPSRDTGPKDPLHRLHFLVLLGQQDMHIP